MEIKFKCLSSGSCGNCYYLGCNGRGILIDAGVAHRTTKKMLKNENIDLSDIFGIFITHDHTDHIKSIGGLSGKEKDNIPAYATSLTHKGIRQSKVLKGREINSRILEVHTPIRIHDFIIESFSVPHDGTDNVGYRILVGGVCFVFATDLGLITEEIARNLCQANYLIMEANYDSCMLQTGPYTRELKARIASDSGHLSNETTAEFLSTHYTPRLKYVWLCHISKDNNTPEMAYSTVKKSLDKKGIHVGTDVRLCALPRGKETEMYIFSEDGLSTKDLID